MNCNYKVQMKDIQNKYKFKIFCTGSGADLNNYYTKNETNALLDAKYDKHTGGIPKADLSNDVQTSLGKADTALQQHQDISGKEDKTNKVTTISSTSTDTQYPSAKAVYTNEQEIKTNLEAQLDETNERVERAEMVYNALPKVNGSGEVITLDNTAETPLKMELSGNTSQFSTTGKNLLNIEENCTFTQLKTVTTPIQAGTYYVNRASVSGGGENGIYLRFNDNDINVGLSSGTFPKQITLTQQETTIRIYPNGVNYSAGQGISATINQLMVSSGSSDTYEPYTGNSPSPSPDYPQDIEVVSGNNKIVVCGKNLLENNVETQTKNNVLFTVNSNKTISTSGTANANAVIDVGRDLGNIFKSGTYTASGCYENGSSSTYNVEIYKVVSGSASRITTLYGKGTDAPTFTLTEDCELFFRITIVNGYNSNGLMFKPMIERNSQATTYEPYQSQEYSVNLGSLELCKIGDYKDKIKKSSGKNLFNNITENKVIASDGTIPNNESWNLGDYIKVQPNTKYTFSRFDGTGQSLIIGEYDTSKTFIQRDVQGGVTAITPYTITTTATTEYVRLNYDNTKGNTLLQFEKGSQATTYEPYGKVWCKYKEIGKAVLNGSESWGGYSTNSFTLNISDIKPTSNTSEIASIKANYYGATSQYAINNSQVDYGIAVRVNQNQLILKDKDMSTTSDLTTWLGTHNTEVYYVLATPINEPITDTTLINQLDLLEKAYAYQNQTNISQSNNDKPFVIDAETVYDLSNLVTRVAILETE